MKHMTILGEGMSLVAAGLGAGLLAALGTTRLIARHLYYVSAADISTFAGVVFFLSAAACLACLVPARRAALSDPVKSIRHD